MLLPMLERHVKVINTEVSVCVCTHVEPALMTLPCLSYGQRPTEAVFTALALFIPRDTGEHFFHGSGFVALFLNNILLNHSRGIMPPLRDVRTAPGQPRAVAPAESHGNCGVTFRPTERHVTHSQTLLNHDISKA